MMAEELDDGEFWLPSEILTDDDFFNDLPSSGSVTGSTGSESDEDNDLLQLAGLTHPITRSSTTPSKGVNLSSSPQSTLCGFGGGGAAQGSSRGSPAEVVSPPPATSDNDGGATWDLLYKAAGEVARMKLRNETAAGAKVGTGFFDCSAAKRPFCPPPPPPAANTNYPYPVHFQPHFPPLSHVNLRQHQQHHQMRSNGCTNNNRPLGLPPSAWPPLNAQAQKQQQPINPSGPSIFLAQPKRESVGTGVFLPRRPAETRKKSETNGAKNRNGKGGNNKSQQQQQQQKTSKPPAVNPKAIQLPQEWTY